MGRNERLQQQQQDNENRYEKSKRRNQKSKDESIMVGQSLTTARIGSYYTLHNYYNSTTSTVTDDYCDMNCIVVTVTQPQQQVESEEERAERIRLQLLTERAVLKRLFIQRNRIRIRPRQVLLPDIVLQQRRVLIMAQRRYGRQ